MTHATILNFRSRTGATFALPTVLVPGSSVEIVRMVQDGGAFFVVARRIGEHLLCPPQGFETKEDARNFAREHFLIVN